MPLRVTDPRSARSKLTHYRLRLPFRELRDNLPPSSTMHGAFDPSAIFAIQRASPKLMTYYFLRTLLTGPLFPLLIVPQYFRYHTMRYRFDAEGISMSWGILFRREIILNYSRIQDIHLSSNFAERWLGLARIQIQTASGSAGAEMTLEGLHEFEAVRNFLYSRMRGTHPVAAAHGAVATSAAVGQGTVLDAASARELAVTLREVAGELRAVRLVLEKKSAATPPPTDAR